MLFSVVIPTYNRAHLLKRCLKSVFSSTLTDIEVLVSDNASPDNTQEILQSFSDARLRYWRNETNVGPCKNQLGLLQQACGQWVFFLTDDDYLMPGALERLSEVLSEHPAVGAVSSSVQNSDEQESDLGIIHYLQGTQELAAGLPALVGLVQTAHLLSRLTLRREWMDVSGFEVHMPSLYPQMFLMGAILKEHSGLYLDECLIKHTVGNETFWEYHPDFMVGANIRMVRDLLPDKKWHTERMALTRQIIAEVSVHHMPLSLAVSVKTWLRHQQHLWRVQEVVASPVYWSGLVQFVTKTGFRKIKAKIKAK